MSSLARETFREFQVHGVPTPFTGRSRELAALRRVFDEAVAEGSLRQVVVNGVEGIGKTRLVRRFTRMLRRDGVVAAVRASEARGHGASAAAVVAQMLRSRFDCSPGDSDAEIRAKLEHGLAGSVTPKRMPEAVALLGSLLGLPIPQEMLYRGIPHPAAFRRKALHRFASQVVTDSGHAPQILVFDQLGNMDTEQLHLFGGLLNKLRDAPVVAVFVSRGSVGQPPLLPDLPVTRVMLEPLGDKRAWQMISGLLGDLEPHREHVAPLLAEVGGNPRRLEELVRVLVQKGVLVAEQGELKVHADKFATTGRLPTDPWIAADSRLHDLKDVELEILGAAAIFGRHFWYDGVLSLLWSGPRGADQTQPGEDKLDRALHGTLLKLMHGDHVRYVNPPQVKGAVELIFSNPYERTSLIRRMDADQRVRMQLHAGRWMLAVKPLDPRSWYRRAAELLDAGARPWEAATAWHKTAEAALDNYEAKEALEAYNKAAARLDQGDAAVMLPIHRGRARAHMLQGEADLALQHYNQVFVAARITSNRALAAEAVLEQGRCLAQLRKRSDATKCLERAAKAFDELGDKQGQARCEEAFAAVARGVGGPGSQEKITWHSRRAMNLWKAAGDSVGLVRNSVSAAIGLLAQADMKHAERLASDALALCKTKVSASAERVAALNLKGALELLQDNNDNAIAAYRQAIRVNNTDGARAEYARLASNLSLAYLRAGEVSVAEDRVREALAVAEEVGDTLGMGYANWRLGTVLATRGSLKAAREALVQALAQAESSRDRWLLAVSAHAVARLLMAAETQPDRAADSELIQGAKAHLATAQQLALKLDDKPLLATVLESLTTYLQRFQHDEEMAAEARGLASRIQAQLYDGFIDAEIETLETPVEKLDILLARAKRAPALPILWATL